MKSQSAILLGLLSFALFPFTSPLSTPALVAQTGKIHGRVTGPEGAPHAGTVSLSLDKGRTLLVTFHVSSSGDYSGEATPNTYTLIYRSPDSATDMLTDSIDNVAIVSGADLLQNVDMTRQAYIDKLTPAEKQHVDELRRMNQELKAINVDLVATMRDSADVISAIANARKELGDAASQSDVELRAEPLTTPKNKDIEALMLKDIAIRPELSILWSQLGQAELGLKYYDKAQEAFKKVIALETASAKPNINLQSQAYTGIGEAYARTGKISNAETTYDAAAKLNPAKAAIYLKTESVIFSQLNNGDAEAAAADKAILADPTLAIAYYLKGDGLLRNSRKNAMGITADCRAAFQKYLELAPNGALANEVKSILAEGR